MNSPLRLQPLPQPDIVNLFPNESAEFLLQKVDWESVIDLGKSTHFGALVTPLALPEPTLKDVQISGSVVTMTFDHSMPLEGEIPEITLNGRRAELVVLDQDALTLVLTLPHAPTPQRQE